MKQAIGIDLGTTSISLVALNAENGAVIRAVSQNSEAFLPSTAPYERIQSPQRILDIALSLLDELICEQTAVIGVTGQMHGILYIDGKGEAVSPLYTWQDGRGDQPYGDTTYAAHLGSCTGYGNVTDFYNSENGLRPSSAVGYCTVHDYLVMKLCGLSSPVMHTSDAASLGCYDMEKGCFTRGYSPEITGDFRIAGEYRGIPVSVAIGDNQASVFSTAREGDLLLNFGTGSQVCVVSDTLRHGCGFETRPYLDGKYLLVGAALCGGRAFSMLKDFYRAIVGQFTEVDESAVYAAMAGMLSEPCENPPTVDTRFDGTRANRDITGSITGLTTENLTPVALTHGLLRGMVRELYDMYEEMGEKRCSLVGSGNGLRKNAALVRLCEDMFGAPMRMPAHPEEAAVGAALFGMVAAGLSDNAAQAQSLIRYRERE